MNSYIIDLWPVKRATAVVTVKVIIMAFRKDILRHMMCKKWSINMTVFQIDKMKNTNSSLNDIAKDVSTYFEQNSN